MLGRLSCTRGLLEAEMMYLASNELKRVSNPETRSSEDIHFHNSYVVRPVLDVASTAKDIRNFTFLKNLESFYFQGLFKEFVQGLVEAEAKRHEFESSGKDNIFYGPLPSGQLEFPFVSYKD